MDERRSGDFGDHEANPRTAEMHQRWRVRDLQRRQARRDRRRLAREQAKVATVVEVNEVGDVKLDRFTTSDGVGEFYSPLNGRVPEVGQSVAYTDVEGVPAVLGPVGEGALTVMPASELTEPGYYVPPDSLLGGMNEGDPEPQTGIYRWPWLANQPFLRVDPMNPRIEMGAAPFILPFGFSWHDHFIGGGDVTETIGREGWSTEGTGSITAVQFSHAIRLQTGATNGNARVIWLGPNGAKDAMRIGEAASPPDACYSEAWFAIRPNQNTSVTYRAGFFSDVALQTQTNGAFFEFTTASMTAAAVVLPAGINTGLFNWEAAGVYLISVRVEPDISGDEYYGTKFTFTRWGNNSQAGMLIPMAQIVHVESEWGSFLGHPGVYVRTAANAARNIDVCYAAGFYYSGNWHSLF